MTFLFFDDTNLQAKTEIANKSLNYFKNIFSHYYLHSNYKVLYFELSIKRNAIFMIYHLRNIKGRCFCNPKLGGFVTSDFKKCNCKECKQKAQDYYNGSSKYKNGSETNKCSLSD